MHLDDYQGSPRVIGQTTSATALSYSRASHIVSSLCGWVPDEMAAIAVNDYLALAFEALGHAAGLINDIQVGFYCRPRLQSHVFAGDALKTVGVHLDPLRPAR